MTSIIGGSATHFEFGHCLHTFLVKTTPGEGVVFCVYQLAIYHPFWFTEAFEVLVDDGFKFL
jgi:hypothetical protein